MKSARKTRVHLGQKPISYPLEIIDLCKSFNTTAVIHHLSLSVRQGEVVGILGPKGTGKTTLFELISGKASPTSGMIKVMGKDLQNDNKCAQRQLGAVSTLQREVNTLGEKHTAREHLQFQVELLGVSFLKYPEWINAALEVVGLAPYDNLRIQAFSSGMKRRLAFARALVHNPSLLVIDEPTSGLASQEHQIIWDLVHFLRSTGKALVLMTSSWEEAIAECDRVILLSEWLLSERKVEYAGWS